VSTSREQGRKEFLINEPAMEEKDSRKKDEF
jgi:hypothetical protein